MTPGYDRPLYVMPFDHRNQYAVEVFGYRPDAPSSEQQVVVESKAIVYTAFERAIAAGLSPADSGILVDDEFGPDILRDAHRKGYVTILPTERCGAPEFEFEQGADFARPLEQYSPTFAKVLVRYNPAGDRAAFAPQLELLRQLNAYLRRTRRLFMFELIVPPLPAQLAKLSGPAQFDRDVRPQLVVEGIEHIQDAGIEPDVWKLEGLEDAEACRAVADATRRGHRGRVGCVVLGRGEDQQRVAHWLTVAASTPGFIGFAVGRSTFLQPLLDWRAKKIDRAEAVEQIANHFQRWVDIFASASRPTPAVGGGNQR